MGLLMREWSGVTRVLLTYSLIRAGFMSWLWQRIPRVIRHGVMYFFLK